MKEKRSIIVIFLEWGTVVSALGLIGTVVLQIVTRRFFVDFAPSWTEEASRFFFIYAISFGAGLAQKEGYFISMDYFYNIFNPKMRGVLDLLISVSSIVLFLLVSIFSIFFIRLGTIETSPSLGLPMSIAFTSMFIMSASVLYFLVVQLYDKIKTANK